MILILIGLLIEVTAVLRGISMIKTQGGIAYPTHVFLMGIATFGFVLVVVGSALA
jgi:hypothetical protein